MESSARGRTASRRAIWILFILLAIVSVWRAGSLAVEYWGAERGRFYHDFYLQLNMAKRLQAGESFYQPQDPSLFPSSMEIYKYPPTFVALLLPFVGQPYKQTARIFLLANFALLLGFLALVIRGSKVAGWRAGLIALLFLNWQPFWETLSGLQLEVTLLFLTALVWLATYRGRDTWGGVALGAAGALKVYPAGALVYFLAKRRWKVVVGTAVGGIAVFLGCALAIGFRHVADFFLHAAPRMGGTSVFHENVSVLGFAGRLALLLTLGAEKARPLFADIHTPLEAAAPASGLLIAMSLYAAVAILLLAATIRAVRRGSRMDQRTEDALMFCAVLTLLLMLMPTSRIDYQTILALPLFVMIAWAPSPSADPIGWACIGLAGVLGGVVNGNVKPWVDLPVLTSVLRGLVPLLLWGTWLRMRRRGGTCAA